MLGGRRRLVRSRPGKTSEGVLKKWANPSEKKFGELPGDEKMSRGIWKFRSPICMYMSVLKSCCVSRGKL